MFKNAWVTDIRLSTGNARLFSQWNLIEFNKLHSVRVPFIFRQYRRVRSPRLRASDPETDILSYSMRLCIREVTPLDSEKAWCKENIFCPLSTFVNFILRSIHIYIYIFAECGFSMAPSLGLTVTSHCVWLASLQHWLYSQVLERHDFPCFRPIISWSMLTFSNPDISELSCHEIINSLRIHWKTRSSRAAENIGRNVTVKLHDHRVYWDAIDFNAQFIIKRSRRNFRIDF